MLAAKQRTCKYREEWTPKPQKIFAIVSTVFLRTSAAGSTPESVVNFSPSEATLAQVAELLRREKTDGLSAEEASELNHFMQIEHLMRLAKAKARKNVDE